VPLVPDTVSDSPAATQAWARSLAAVLAHGAVVLLDGPMGAGKTTMTRGLVEGLGGEGRQVSSPTYVLVNRYDTPGGWVFHLDAYRLKSGEDLTAIGFDDLLAEARLVVVEWPSRVEEAMPNGAVRVVMEVVDEGRRRLRVQT
jgi:tRNA threonylcarbamoyladenosine biosynthesis protein TsaE